MRESYKDACDGRRIMELVNQTEKYVLDNLDSVLDKYPDCILFAFYINGKIIHVPDVEM